ncbi:hypothetical protein JW998_07320 [candidate division KSB1 bacterium]|nr:hypothetical protein [candidate division KSB1 bacterium]
MESDCLRRPTRFWPTHHSFSSRRTLLYIIDQLARHNYHRGKAARALGIAEATLYRKMHQLEIIDVP